MANEIKFNNGINDCSDRIAIVKNETVPRNLTSLTEVASKNDLADTDYAFISDDNGTAKKIKAKELVNSNDLTADWNATEGEIGYIKNKPGVDNLESDMVSLYNIGGIASGHTFPAGTTVREILDRMFNFSINGYFIPHLLDHNPGELTYAELVALDTSASQQKFTPEILANGYTWTIDTSIKERYFFVAVMNKDDANIKVTKITQAGFEIELEPETSVGEYKVYYFDRPSKGKFTLVVSFKSEG